MPVPPELGGRGGGAADFAAPSARAEDRIVALLRREARSACPIPSYPFTFATGRAALISAAASGRAACQMFVSAVLDPAILLVAAVPLQTALHKWALRLEAEWAKLSAAHAQNKKLANAAKEARAALTAASASDLSGLLG